MIDLLTKELLAIKQEILRLKTASEKSAIGLGATSTSITLNTTTSGTGDNYGRALILVQSDEPFIVQGYFDDTSDFQNDHISFIETLFFPASGVALLVVKVINKSAGVATFTDKMSIVTTSSVAISISYEE